MVNKVRGNLRTSIVLSLGTILFQTYIPFHEAFQLNFPQTKTSLAASTTTGPSHHLLNLSSSEVETNDYENDDDKDSERSKLKRELFKLSASYDRGYGSTETSRFAVNNIIDRLKALNPTEEASRGIDGNNMEDNIDTPIIGIWQMVWTTAQDVLLLNASPLSTVGAIYQVITDPPIITNVIDLIPRSQAILPPNFASSLLRLEVTTRAKLRTSDPNRIGLNFEKVKATPKQFLGFNDVDTFFPPLKFNLPSLSVLLSSIPEEVKSSLGIDGNADGSENYPGYFDVIYLDDELLIIQQNAPGGLFVLVKSDSYDP